MPGRAKSNTKKAQIAREKHAAFIQRGIDAYKLELTKPNGKGARTVAADFIKLYKMETGKDISISYSALIRGAQGQRTKAEANAARSWLTDGEVKVVIQYIVEMANRGFPLSHRRLSEHVNEILHARLGATFPGVGKQWSHRFVEKHSSRIKTGWSTTLDSKRGRAVNPHTKASWFQMLEDVVLQYKIVEETTYGTDEVGCNPSEGQKEWVMGGHKPGPQYQQRDGIRENVTVIVTICADGTSTPPAVIFKGKGYQVQWKQNNPANASIGYSVKGWTNGAIALEWLMEFDRHTKEKANGRYRLLLVDGHNSHYTRKFLEYARMNKILVLCYPAHTTHVLQGLDVVVFAVVKRCLAEERDIWERETGEKISKKNFLGIYGRAHLRSLSAENITAAFRKTGVWPFNPNVITEEMMAPSKETSCKAHLPIAPASPIRAIAELLKKLTIEEDKSTESESDDEGSGGTTADGCDSESGSSDEEGGTEEGNHSGGKTGWHEESIRTAIHELSKGALTDLVNPNPMPSTQMNHNTTAMISPNKNRAGTLNITPSTTNETLLLAALRESEAREAFLRQRVIVLQASNILNEAYCEKLRGQLAYQEEKAQKKGKGKAKLMGDGLPHLLSNDEFYERVVDHEAAQKEAERSKDKRQQARVDRVEALAEWKRQQEERTAVIATRREEWVKEVEEWEAEKRAAQAAKKKVGRKKPLLGPLPKAIPRPKVVSVNDEGEEGDETGDEEGSETQSTGGDD